MTNSDKLCVILLGTPRTELPSGEFKLPGRKSLGLLAYLAINSPQAYTREHLAGYFWPNLPEKDARNNLRVAIARINKVTSIASATLLQADRLTVRISPDFPLWVDVLQYWSLLPTSPSDGTAESNQTSMATAIGLFHGEFMEGFHLGDCEEFEDWQSGVREHIRMSIVSTLRALSIQSQRIGEVALAERYTRQQLVLDPFDEEAHRRLMHLLNNNNMRNAAIEHFLLVKARLHQDLGVLPDNETIELYEYLNTQNTKKSTTYEHDSASDVIAIAHNLPADKTPYVGNRAVLAQLHHHLANQRLVTLTGVGGIGKTRMAIQLAREVFTEYEHGVWFIPLAALELPADILGALSNTLQITAQAGVAPLLTITEYLNNKNMLVIFDNFEHLLEGKDIIDALLQKCESITLMVTSRQRLQLTMEAVFPVSGLAFGEQALWIEGRSDDSTDATELFVSAAKRSRLNFKPSDAEISTIRAITSLVQGHPLAIVLAASWMESLSCEDILNELQSDIGFLATEATDVPERQRSVQSTFEYSWQLLNDEEKLLFASLSVFRGGFDRHASQQVVGATLRQLSRLVSKSLIEYSQEQSRYDLHEVMRQFAKQKLIESGHYDDIASKCSQYYLRETVAWSRAILETFSIEIRSRLDADFENIQAAWDHAIQCQQEHQWAPAISAIRVYCSLQGRPRRVLEMLRPVFPLVELQESASDDSRLKLNLLLAKGVAIRQTSGYYANELLPIFSQAYSLTDELDNSAELFVALYGKWSFNITRGNYADNRIIIDQWRERLDTMDANTLNDTVIADARFVVNMLEGPNLQCMGHVKQAQHIMQQGLRLENTARHTAMMATYGLNFSVSGRYWLAINLCISGAIHESEKILAQAASLSQAENDPYLSMFTTFAFVSVYTLRKDSRQILEHVASIQSQVAEHRIFDLFAHHSSIYAEYAYSLQGDKSALDRMRMLCDGDKGVPSYALFDTQLLVSELLNAGFIEEAKQRLQKINHSVASVGMKIHDSETLRLQGLSAMLSGDVEQASDLLHRSIESAQQQDCRLYELRSFTQLLELQMSTDNMTGSETAVALAKLMRQFANQPDIPDIKKAQSAISQSRKTLSAE